MTATAGRPRARPRWVSPDSPDATALRLLAVQLQLPDRICGLLHRRGYHITDNATRFLRPRLEQLDHGVPMLGLEEAVERLKRAVERGETVLVHGDYDVDGICSTTLMTRTLRALGGKVVPFIPRRIEDGYDLTQAGVRAAVDAGASVVVTCDCGTSARTVVADLAARGIDVIVTDHHLPGGPLPECVAVLNPKRPGCCYPDGDLAGVGVAFRLALSLTRAMGAPDAIVFRMLDLVALATVADIAPLRGENRVLVRYGLKLLAETPNVGLRALLRAAGLEGKPLTAGRVGYILAPRLNAVGRLGHALRGVELLLCENEHDANTIARELEELNRRRQELDRATLDSACRMVDQLDLDETYGIVLASEGWHPGVIGIVASRIVEQTSRPTVLVALTGDEGKGSGRSIPAFDLHAGLGACSDLFERFGGHRAAAGVTIRTDRVAEFAERFNAVARERLTPDDLIPEIRIDAELPIDEIDEELETLLRHFEPFGVGNPAPVFVSRGVRLAGAARVVGQDGLKLRLRTGTRELEAIGWGMGALTSRIDPAIPVDVAYRLERDEYRGVSRLQLKLADIRW